MNAQQNFNQNSFRIFSKHSFSGTMFLSEIIFVQSADSGCLTGFHEADSSLVWAFLNLIERVANLKVRKTLFFYQCHLEKMIF